MKRLVFDIETIGEDFSSFDETTKKALTHWIERTSKNEEEYKKNLEDLKNNLGFSPLTGEIVAIGVLDHEKKHGVVYFQAPDEKYSDFEESEITYKRVTEKEMLEHFWRGVSEYEEFITFNGRGFDVPFIVARSAKYGIKPTKDLMSNRYLGSQRSGNLHIDLQDQLSFYGAAKRGSLHLWSRLFGIQSPKEEGVTGDDVPFLFKEKRYKDIARYNARDLWATSKLFEHWDKYIRP